MTWTALPKGWRPCPKAECPEPTPPAQRYCDAHMVEYEKSRGTKAERGYGADYQRLRLKWALRIAKGIVNCRRCKRWINPAEVWHLDHDDRDRNDLKLAAPSHELCNLSAGGKASHREDARGPDPSPPPF